MPAPKYIVPGEFIPTVAGTIAAATVAWNHQSLSVILTCFLIGLSGQIILMLYRAISVGITMLITFEEASDTIPKLYDLLNGILRPGTPSNRRPPPPA